MKFFFNGGAYTGIIDAIKKAGHTVCGKEGDPNTYNWLYYAGDKDKNYKYNTEILRKAILEETPDVYFCAKGFNEANGLGIWPETTQFIKDHVGITAYWSQDDPNFMGTFIGRRLSTGYDLGLTCAAASFEEYRKVGIDPYLFWPALDTVGRTFTEVPEGEKVDFAFAGTPYKVTEVPRSKLVSGILSLTDSVELYGDYWVEKNPKQCVLASGDPVFKPYYKGVFSPWMDVHKVFEKARMTFSNHIHRANMYLNDRIPISMGSRCCTFIDRNQGLDLAFEHDKEAVFFENYEDFMHKFTYYLNNPEASRAIGLYGRRKILSEHTYEHRVKFLLEILAVKGFK